MNKIRIHFRWYHAENVATPGGGKASNRKVRKEKLFFARFADKAFDLLRRDVQFRRL